MKPFVAAILVGLFCSLPCTDVLGQNCSQASSLTTVVTYLPPSPQIVRPDLSNPGARALALGGAFSATADDSTATIANPAGLASQVATTAQYEIRLNPVVQIDRYTDKVMQPGSFDSIFTGDGINPSLPPMFFSIAKPVGDQFAIGFFGQVNFSSQRDFTRQRATDGSPCFSSFYFGNPQLYTLPLYRVDEDIRVYRFGVSGAYRLTEQWSLGLSIFGATEKRSQTFESLDPGLPSAIPTYLESSSTKFGFVAGLQYTASETLRFGLVYSNPIEFDRGTQTGPGFTGEEEPLVTIFPMRVGFGSMVSFSDFLLAVDAVWVQTSAIKDQVLFPKLLRAWPATARSLDAGNWKQDDSWEVRLGLEYNIVKRQYQFAFRGGFFYEKASDLRFDPASLSSQDSLDRVYDDWALVLFPRSNTDDFMHVTFGAGAILAKKFQIDIGADYEFNVQKKWVISTLLGYQF